MCAHENINVHQNLAHNHKEPEADLKSARLSGAACHSLPLALVAPPPKGSAPMNNFLPAAGAEECGKHGSITGFKKCKDSEQTLWRGKGENDVIML